MKSYHRNDVNINLGANTNLYLLQANAIWLLFANQARLAPCKDILLVCEGFHILFIS